MPFAVSQHKSTPPHVRRRSHSGRVYCVGACAHSWGLLQGDLTVFSHTLVSADLSCSYLHQTSGEKKKKETSKLQGRKCVQNTTSLCIGVENEWECLPVFLYLYMQHRSVIYESKYNNIYIVFTVCQAVNIKPKEFLSPQKSSKTNKPRKSPSV